MKTYFEILLRRKNKILLVEPELYEDINEASVLLTAGIVKNIQTYGYTVSKKTMETLSHCKEDLLIYLNSKLVEEIKELVGAEIAQAAVFYPNFPKEVQELSDSELLVNAIVHYFSGGTLVPDIEKDERLPLLEGNDFIELEIGSMQDIAEIRNNLMQSNTSISGVDKDDLKYLYLLMSTDEYPVPSEIPFKENVAIIASMVMDEPVCTVKKLQPVLKTATDVLRTIAYISDGDVSLAQKFRVKSIPRRKRRLLLNVMSEMSLQSLEEDMLRHKSQWLRVGEMLHPSEMQGKVTKAFDAIRNNAHISTFQGRVQALFNDKEYIKAAELLATRPAELARRLDELLRKVEVSEQGTVIDFFESVADKVSTRVLLQVLEHFYNRDEEQVVRVIFPKGNVARATMLPNLEPMSPAITSKITQICQNALIQQYASMNPLGKVYIDPELSSYVIPYSQRSASKTLKAVTRGSHIKMNSRDNIIRGFIHWTNMGDTYDCSRVDIDLSACILDENWKYKSHLSYTNLRDKGMKCWHSGDITNGGPVNGNGVAEFIDCDIDSIVEAGGRYLVYQVYSYTGQKFSDLPRVSFGWMGRLEGYSGEVFEPSTVQQKMDLNTETTVAIPVIFDCVEREIIWCDMALGINQLMNHQGGNNLESNFNAATATCYAMANMNKVDMYYLAYLHAQARGELVTSREEADIIFSNDTTKPMIEVQVEVEVENEDGEIVKQIETKLEEKDVKFITAYDVDEFYTMV